MNKKSNKQIIITEIAKFKFYIVYLQFLCRIILLQLFYVPCIVNLLLTEVYIEKVHILYYNNFE